jgi:hypothetical protein
MACPVCLLSNLSELYLELSYYPGAFVLQPKLLLVFTKYAVNQDFGTVLDRYSTRHSHVQWIKCSMVITCFLELDVPSFCHNSTIK